AFILCTILNYGNVYAQGFHHPPPPPHHPPHQPQTPQRPPTPPPTRFVPPVRSETMRPPTTKSSSQISTNIEILTEWKDEVVERVKDIGNWLLGFEGDDDTLDIEEDDDTFNIEDSRTEVLDADPEIAEKVAAENAYWADVKATWPEGEDPESMFFNDISEFLSTLNDDGSPKISNLKLTDSPKEPAPTTPELTPADTPKEPAPLQSTGQDQQPEVTAKPSDTPTTPEVKVVDTPKEAAPSTVADESAITPEIKIDDMPKKQIKPTLPEMIKITDDIKFEKWEKILTKNEQNSDYQLRAQKDPNPRYELKIWDGPKQPREELRALPKDWERPLTTEEMMKSGFETVVLTTINVEFPIVGVVVSAGLGFKDGWDKASKGGGDMYQKLWNAGAVATKNVIAGAAFGKATGGALNKLKIPSSGKLDYGNDVTSNYLATNATQTKSGFEPALIPMATKYFLEGVPDKPSEYVQHDPGTFGAQGGLTMRTEYRAK
ncbi:MAG: hypothetical protein KAG92_04865, partial [Deltaproteobacteria bacterium]|nr:hypothetical protein [Deltaproteobacteria bacterium]